MCEGLFPWIIIVGDITGGFRGKKGEIYLYWTKRTSNNDIGQHKNRRGGSAKYRCGN